MPGSILPLRLEGVCYDAGGARLIRDISFMLTAGTRTVILGPNGAGKSLILRLCHGLLRPSAGTVRWSDSGGVFPRRRQAMVFQTPVMLRRSAAANIAYALSLSGFSRSRRRESVAKALEWVGLEALAHRPARVLSAGEQQRLALARAWVLEPEVLFLDEPTANLDPTATRAIEETIDTMHRSGTKIVMTTHSLGQAHRLADEVLFLHRGRLVDHTPAEAFFAGPQSSEAKAFLRRELLW